MPVLQPARARNPRGKGTRLREELVAAASRLLESGDPSAVTLRGVAREAGVAAPSVYGHFDDLDDLLRTVVERHLAALRRAVEAAADAADDPVGRLRAAALAYVVWGTSNPGAYAVVFGGRAVRLLTDAETVAFADGDALLDLLGRLVAAVPGAPDVASRTLAAWTGLHGTVSLRTGKPGYPWPPLDAHVDAALAGVLPTGRDA
ncbi:TetR/AcrR family transcriptional regulator [Aquipuribacter nitratireducens]|uniref:TetR/AcrR family transcriptional regulator n=1 Tax=Aquipuribacter nitratireducens TaxID=650104 RepID=A0ABW0GQU0_9MICO